MKYLIVDVGLMENYYALVTNHSIKKVNNKPNFSCNLQDIEKCET